MAGISVRFPVLLPRQQSARNLQRDLSELGAACHPCNLVLPSYLCHPLTLRPNDQRMESHSPQSTVDAPFAPPKIQAEPRVVLWAEAEEVSMESWGKTLEDIFPDT